MNNKYPKEVLASLKKFFVDEKTHITMRLTQLDSEDPLKDPDHAVDNADVLTDVNEELTHDQVIANKKSLEKRLAQIDLILKNINDGTYGFCLKCHKMIDTDRLSSNPYTVYCIECAKGSSAK